MKRGKLQITNYKFKIANFIVCLSSFLFFPTAGAVLAEARPDSTDVSALIRALDGGDLTARAAAVEKLSGRGQGGIPDLEGVIREGSWWAREGALEALAGMGERGLPTLALAARSDAREEVRRFATRMLGRVKEGAARDVLLGLMADARVRSVAAAALGDLGDSAAVPALVRALGDDGPRSVRRASAASLGRLRASRAVGPLIRAIQDPHHSVRSAAAGALAAIGAPAVKPLSDVLRDADPLVRALAVETLGRIGGAEAATPIAACLKDPDWGVRSAAAQGLGLCGASPALPALRGQLAREPDGFVLERLREAIRKIEEKR